MHSTLTGDAGITFEDKQQLELRLLALIVAFMRKQWHRRTEHHNNGYDDVAMTWHLCEN